MLLLKVLKINIIPEDVQMVFMFQDSEILVAIRIKKIFFVDMDTKEGVAAVLGQHM